MSAVVKYSAIAIGIQLALTAIFVGVGGSSGLLVVIDFYYPVIFSIIKVGRFTGESTMMLPVFFGVPVGIVIYGLIIGFLSNWFKKKTLFEKRSSP